MMVRVFDNKLQVYRLVNIAVVIPAEDHLAYKHEIVYDGNGKGDSALWLQDGERFVVAPPWYHIHWFTPTGDWTGYQAEKKCRCGQVRKYDIY